MQSSKFLRDVLPVLALLLMAGCDRSSDISYQVEGSLRALHDGGGIVGAHVEWSEQIIEGGMLQGAAEVVAEDWTVDEGAFAFGFARRQALSYRLQALSEGHFPLSIAYSPNDLRPDEVFKPELRAAAICSVAVRLHHVSEANSGDVIQFRFGEDFAAELDCVCCPTEMRSWAGPEVDTMLACAMHGNRWMTYWVRTEMPAQGVDSIWIDSLWCPAYGAGELTLNW